MLTSSIMETPIAFAPDLSDCVGMSLHGNEADVCREFKEQVANGKNFYQIEVNGEPRAMYSIKYLDAYYYYDVKLGRILLLENVAVFGGWLVPKRFRGNGLLWHILHYSFLAVDKSVSHIVSGVRSVYLDNGEPAFLAANRHCWKCEPTSDFTSDSLVCSLQDETPSIHPEALASNHVLLKSFNSFGIDPYDGSPRYIFNVGVDTLNLQEKLK